MILPPPIGSIASIARIIGPEAAFRLAETRGGGRIFVPKFPRPETDLARVIGPEAAEAMSREWPGLQIKVPVARAWRVIAYRDNGDSYDVIATRVGIDRTAVERIVKGKGRTAGPAQLDMFAGD